MQLTPDSAERLAQLEAAGHRDAATESLSNNLRFEMCGGTFSCARIKRNPYARQRKKAWHRGST